MSLETGTYIADLVTANPPGNDPRSQGDDHIRLLKTVLKNTFPNASRAFPIPNISSKVADFSVVATDANTTFLMDTGGGSFQATLPTLAGSDAGWECAFIRIGTGVNPYFVAPPSGVLYSGPLALAKTRRAIPHVRVRAFWTGGSFIIERAEKAPVGSIIDLDSNTLPAGYEWPLGQTLAGTAGSLYPDYYAAKGSLVTRDITGRVVAMQESVASRLTPGGSGIDGATLGAVGGAETHVLTAGQLAAHQHTGSTGGQSADHTHQTNAVAPTGTFNPTQGGSWWASTGATTTTSGGASNDHTHAFTTDVAGSNQAHNNVQPTIVLAKILVVE